MYSEMLGNQYFLSRNYEKAASNLQFVVSNEPLNKSARKKLVICYSQIGQIKSAFDIFYSLVKEDINFIADTDPIADDCPCPELVDRYGKYLPFEENSIDLRLMLGMLWLYCDATKSLNFFTSLLNEKLDDPRLMDVVLLIEEKIKSPKKNTN